MKFNVDGFSMTPGARFMTGRIVGTIGPAGPDEPRHFVAGRQFMATAGPGAAAFFAPAGEVNFCVAAVDHATRRVYLDLGNALPTTAPGGPHVRARRPRAVPGACRAGGGSGWRAQSIGVLSAAYYTDPAWYPATAGIAVFPPDRPLTDDELAAVSRRPALRWSRPAPGGQPTVLISEPADGLFVRADQFVFRLSPGERRRWSCTPPGSGARTPGAGVITVPVPEQLQPDSPLAPGQAPPVAVPADAVQYPVRVVTDARGRARLRMRARDPGRPRDYIDGQVYALCPVLEETIVARGRSLPVQPVELHQPAGLERFHAGRAADLARRHRAGAAAVRQPVPGDAGLPRPGRLRVGVRARQAPRLRPSASTSTTRTRCRSPATCPPPSGSAILRWLSEPGEDGKPLPRRAAARLAGRGAVPAPVAAAPAPGARDRRRRPGAAAARRQGVRRQPAASGPAKAAPTGESAMIRVHPEVSALLRAGDVHGVRDRPAGRHRA